MIIVTVKSKTKPENTNEYLKEFKNISPEVRAENGCLEYELYPCRADNSEFFLFERWESKEALDAHLKTGHMIEFISKTQDWFESKDIKIYEAL
ncbi:MAG TPA: antibiotic biosynthesis monooxygenase [Bacteroidales bacterium]|jgi:quinol monooxygenase YgiN|nr:antibiotic biosynthesis monooxygenase [Bacteroidales bacterium]